MKKKIAAPSTGATSNAHTDKFTLIPTKHELCLHELLEEGLRGIHKIGRPSKEYGETCLPTTISQLGLQRGIQIDRERRPHTHRSGGKTYFTWYWLTNRQEAVKAVRLLNFLRGQRGAFALSDEDIEMMLERFPEFSPSAA